MKPLLAEIKQRRTEPLEQSATGGAIARQPATIAPRQPSPSLPARGTPRAPMPNPASLARIPARATFTNVPTAGGQVSTVTPSVENVTTGAPGMQRKIVHDPHRGAHVELVPSFRASKPGAQTGELPE